MKIMGKKGNWEISKFYPPGCLLNVPQKLYPLNLACARSPVYRQRILVISHIFSYRMPKDQISRHQSEAAEAVLEAF
jgi:hypothetical protein